MNVLFFQLCSLIKLINPVFLFPELYSVDKSAKFILLKYAGIP